MSCYVNPKPDDGDRLRHDSDYDWAEGRSQGRLGAHLHQRVSGQEVDEYAFHLVQDAQHDGNVEQLVAEMMKIKIKEWLKWGKSNCGYIKFHHILIVYFK